MIPVTGKCQNCGMQGLLTRDDHFIPIEQLSAFNAGEPIYSQPMWLCITCEDTPTGCVSENVTHHRLPEAAYERERVKQ